MVVYLAQNTNVYNRKVGYGAENNNMDIYEIRNELSRNISIFEMPLRVTYYTRVSTSTDEQLHSLQNQIEYFEKYIKQQKKWTLVGGYIDEGITGTSVLKRDAFNKMMEDAEHNLFDLVITKEVSRFARNTLDSILYTRKLLKYNVGVLFQNDNINTLDRDSELRLTIMASLAQEESRKISERVKFGQRQSVKRGVVFGNDKIWGYKKENGNLVIVEEEAKIVNEIFDLYCKGFGFRAIEKILDEKGYKNNNGNPISYSTLSGIIKNPKYKGFYVANKSATVDYLTKQRKYLGKSDWLMYKDETGEKVPAIVHEEVWDRANAILNKRSEKMSSEDKTSYQNKYVYSGSIFCGTHKCTYWHNKYKYISGEKTIWQCKIYRKEGKNGCLSPHIYTHELNYIMTSIVREILGESASVVAKLIKIYNDIMSETDYKKKIQDTERKIHLIDSKKDKNFELAVEGRLSNSEFQKRNDKLNEEIEILKKQIEEYENILRAKQNNIEKLNQIEAILNEDIKSASGISEDLIRIFLEKIEVYGSNICNSALLHIFLKVGREVIVFYKKALDSEEKSGMRLSYTTHIIRADIETEIAPIIGTEKQSEEFVTYFMNEFESNPEKIWSSNMFGKSLYDMVTDELQGKLYKMPEDVQGKLQLTLNKVVNDSKGGIVCIII